MTIYKKDRSSVIFLYPRRHFDFTRGINGVADILHNTKKAELFGQSFKIAVYHAIYNKISEISYPFNNPITSLINFEKTKK